jgi:hypothetical protein
MKRTPQSSSSNQRALHSPAEETVAGCRELAVADLARALLVDTANGRQRLETSAACWTSRAESIQDFQDASEARLAIAKSEWDDGEAPPLRRDHKRNSAS